jgi:antitoxin component of RelBE/YafQ-DinJ toxin-antitoxin module
LSYESYKKLADSLGIKTTNTIEELYEYLQKRKVFPFEINHLRERQDYYKIIEIKLKIEDLIRAAIIKDPAGERFDKNAIEKWRTAVDRSGVDYFKNFYEITLKEFKTIRGYYLWVEEELRSLEKTLVDMKAQEKADTEFLITNKFNFSLIIIYFCYGAALFYFLLKYMRKLDLKIENLKITDIKSRGWSEEWRRREAESDREYIVANSAKTIRLWLRNKHKSFYVRSFIALFLGENFKQIRKCYINDNMELYKRLQLIEGDQIND